LSTFFHFLSNRHVAADQRNSVATAYLIAGARDRHIQIANAARNNALGKGRHAVRIAGAHAQHNLFRAVTERRKQMVPDHILHLLRVEHGDNDATHWFRQLRDR